MMTVIEVFIFDHAGITELWRALSFISLGIVLIDIGLAHQHLRFGPRSRPLPASEPTAMLSSPRNCIGTAVGSAKLLFDKFKTGGPHADT